MIPFDVSYRHFTLACMFMLPLTAMIPAQSTVEPVEYSVLSDLMRSIRGDDVNSQFVIARERQPDVSDGKTKYLVRKFRDQELVNDFNKRNARPAEFQNLFHLKSAVIIIDPALQKKLETSADGEAEALWETFRNTYRTDSLLYLSRVGLNRRKDKALVLFASISGWLGGQGFYYLLVKKEKAWVIKKKTIAWIS
jgi:hypothetical protein